tara:strand:- start:2784 stop:4598 length:1815 start_codon:yes stop_codon:yes gene_type:complete
MLYGRNRSLLWQVGVVLVVLQLVLVVVVGWFLEARIASFFNQQRLDELRSLAPWVAGSIGPAGDDTRAVQGLSSADRWADGLRVTVVDQDGVVIADSEEDPAVMDNHRFRPEIDEAFKDGSAYATRFSSTLQQELIYYALRRGPVDRPQVVRVALPLTQLQQQLAGVSQTVVLVLCAYFLATIGIIFFVSRWLSRSVRELADGANRFARGDLTHRVPVYPGREFDLLSQSLNQMAEQLSQRLGQLRLQGSELTSILQSMSNGVIALDLDCRILSMNRVAQNMFELIGRDTRGHLLQEFVRDPELSRFVETSIRQGERRFEEIKLVSLGDRSMEITSEPLLDVEDQVVGVVLVLNEVTLLRRLESIRTDFAANVSHELRTPIMAIQGYAELLTEDQDASTRRDYAAVVLRNTMRLSAIIEDLLSLARLEEPDSTQDLSRESIAPLEILETVASDCGDEAMQRGISIEVRPGAAREVFVNRQLVIQAITNLVVNALRYSEKGSSVELAAQATVRDCIDFTVRDTGPGIAPEHLHRLFERFYRVDKGRSREMGGTGLGLAIVKHVAQVHGGTVEVESTVGQGSMFAIRLPLMEPVESLGESVDQLDR